eukprot:1158421-Pelagomonas_calceolata.AAC.18
MWTFASRAAAPTYAVHAWKTLPSHLCAHFLHTVHAMQASALVLCQSTSYSLACLKKALSAAIPAPNAGTMRTMQTSINAEHQCWHTSHNADSHQC